MGVTLNFTGMLFRVTLFLGFFARGRAEDATAASPAFLSSRSLPVDAYKIRNSLFITVRYTYYENRVRCTCIMNVCHVSTASDAKTSASNRKCNRARGCGPDAGRRKVPRDDKSN